MHANVCIWNLRPWDPFKIMSTPGPDRACLMARAFELKPFELQTRARVRAGAHMCRTRSYLMVCTCVGTRKISQRRPVCEIPCGILGRFKESSLTGTAVDSAVRQKTALIPPVFSTLNKDISICRENNACFAGRIVLIHVPEALQLKPGTPTSQRHITKEFVPNLFFLLS